MLNRDYDKFIDIACANLAIRNGGILRHPVKLINAEGEQLHFESSRKAAHYLSDYYGIKAKSFSDKFHMRRRHIFDFDVEYCEVQRLDTAALRSKEQSNKYLVGTLDRFNDAKRAEVKDRVKHDTEG
jgi:hypothetical protein